MHFFILLRRLKSVCERITEQSRVPLFREGPVYIEPPQGKIECNDCVTRVSWPSPLGQNRFIALFSRLCIFFILLRRLKSVCERILSKNRTKLSPFVSRGSNLFRAPQGKIECDDCVTWVSWPRILGKKQNIY